MPLDRYRAVMRMPYVARLLSTSLVARMPNGMSGLAILLLVTRHHGYAHAGIVTGAYVAAAGVSNLLLSRAADRWGPHRVLLPAAFGYATGMLALAVVPGEAYAAELVLAVAAGVSSPPVVSVVRGLWPRMLDRAEFYALLLLSTAGMTLLAVSSDLIMVFLSVELLSLALYVMAGFERGRLVHIRRHKCRL